MLRRFRHSREGLAGLLLLVPIVLAALLAPWLSPGDPQAMVGPALLKPSGRTQNPAGIVWNNVHNNLAEKGFSGVDYPANFEEFLKAKPADKPFFFLAGTHEPHAPWDPGNADKLKAKYGIGLEDMKVPDFLPE